MVNTSLSETRTDAERQELLNQTFRKRLARKIHDDISQKLTLLSLQLSLAATEEAPPANWSTTCEEWGDLVMDLGQAVRQILTNLEPRVTDELGLLRALHSLSQSLTGKIHCTLHAPAQPISLPPRVGEELFLLCREIVTDILIPGKAPSVEFKLEQKDGSVAVQVRAAGFLTEYAMETICARQRLQCLDGTVALNTSESALTIVTFSVPAMQSECCAAA